MPPLMAIFEKVALGKPNAYSRYTVDSEKSSLTPKQFMQLFIIKIALLRMLVTMSDQSEADIPEVS